MKIYAFIIVTALFLSCSYSENKSTTRLHSFADQFIKSHENFSQNQMLNDQVNKELQHVLTDSLNNGLLSDQPMQLDFLSNKTGRPIAHFVSSDNNNGTIIESQVFAAVSNEQATSLTQGKRYLIEIDSPLVMRSEIINSNPIRFKTGDITARLKEAKPL